MKTVCSLLVLFACPSTLHGQTVHMSSRVSAKEMVSPSTEKFVTRIVFETDKPVSKGFRADFDCDHNVLWGHWEDDGTYAASQVRTAGDVHVTIIFGERTPAFDPNNPVRVKLVSDVPLSCFAPAINVFLK